MSNPVLLEAVAEYLLSSALWISSNRGGKRGLVEQLDTFCDHSTIFLCIERLSLGCL